MDWSNRSGQLASAVARFDPYGFFLWGFVKDKVMSTSPTTLDDMKDRIRSACLLVTPEMLERVRNSFRRRVRTCLKV